MDWYNYGNPPFVPTTSVEPPVMEVEREEPVYPSVFPCKDFLRAAGILEDFNELISNAGLEHFVANELPQYAKLTMSFVQSFKFHNSRDNPTVSFNIYHKAVDMRLSEFCREIKVPSWGTSGRIKEDSREFKSLFLGFCQGKNRIADKGRIKIFNF